MKHIELTEKIPATMTVVANAVFNEDKNVWEVSIFESATCRSLHNEPLYYQNSQTIEIAECDELVIPFALLETSGIKTECIEWG